MALDKLMIPPDKNGYSFADGTETISIKLDGGLSRYRKDVLKSSFVVNVQWTIGEKDYRYLRSFYRGITESGSKAFLMDILVDRGCELTEHECFFIPGSFTTNNVSGETFTVSAQIECKLVGLADTDQEYVYWYNAFGGYTIYYEDLFNTIINTFLPNDIPYPV